MIFQIKPDYYNSYPAQLRHWNFTFLSAAIHPQFNTWTVLLVGQDGELYSMKREQVRVVTPLEILL